ncbi:phage late control D family protein [Paracoccus aestuariivivens]|uniref:Late control protein D n=1 Tax=Paracoccus aestuariivivens TaxID=1820333 RepID=A0A6L6J9D3_9RHOB|nr:contractile injection system protein, VgrG/Pvc8 family [Paracoccus aestuariivivens]MTH78763.1 late control protein D [Paracoccus aestuariivivens]
MGLTDWKPTFKVRVNGRDMTSVFLPRVSSIMINDTAGIQADTCEIVLTDHLPIAPLEIPPAGAEIEISLGYMFLAQVVGIYIADEVEVSGPPGQMRITAYATAHGKSDGGKGPITEARSRSWPEETSVADMVAKIAADSGFKTAVSDEAGKVVLPHIDQIDESDINVLTRIARDQGLIFKPAGGTLVVCKTGESTAVSGQPLPIIALTPKHVSRWSMRMARRVAYAKVVAAYRDFAQSEPVDVEVEAKPEGVTGVAQIKRLKSIYPSEAAARAAADAEAKRGQRAARTIQMQLPGRADLIAEGRLMLAGFRTGVAGEWLITRVVHTLGSDGWVSAIEAETPSSG